MLIKQESTKISDILKMLLTYFLQNETCEKTTVELNVQRGTIQSALDLGYIESEKDRNGDILYCITSSGKTYRDSKK